MHNLRNKMAERRGARFRELLGHTRERGWTRTEYLNEEKKDEEKKSARDKAK